MTSQNALTTFVRQESSITENVLVSQQIYYSENIELLLDKKYLIQKKPLCPRKKTNLTYRTKKDLEQFCGLWQQILSSKIVFY